MLRNRRATSPSLKALKDFISGINFIKIGRSLSINGILRCIPTISTWFTDNPSRQEITRNICSNSLLIVEEKVLLKSIPYIYE